MKVRLLIVQLPKEGLQLVLASELNSAGALTTKEVRLAAKEEPIAKGELMTSVIFEF